MSIKAERGTKRLCPSCGGKFYDLNRDPIICPICHNVYEVAGAPVRAGSGGNNLDADDDAILDAGRGGLEFVSMEEVAATEGEDLPEIEGSDLAEADGGDVELDTGSDEEPFLEAEDEGEDDVSGFVGGGSNDEEV